MAQGIPVRKPTEEELMRMGSVEHLLAHRRWQRSVGAMRPKTPVDRALDDPAFWVDFAVREDDVIPVPPPPVVSDYTFAPSLREQVTPTVGNVELLENLASIEGWRSIMVRKSGKRMIGMLLMLDSECPDEFIDQFEVATKLIEGAETAHLKLV